MMMLSLCMVMKQWTVYNYHHQKDQNAVIKIEADDAKKDKNNKRDNEKKKKEVKFIWTDGRRTVAVDVAIQSGMFIGATTCF